MRIFAWLLVAHFVGDYVLQRNSWARDKSKSVFALSKHILVYSAILLLFCIPLFGWQIGITFALVNGSAHWLTDFVTSKFTSRLWEAKRVHDFFVVIGIDQLIHYLTMILILVWWGIQ